jgi:hypothetical protein
MKTSEHPAEIYRSSNGDCWSLERPLNGLPMVVHEAKLASGGKRTRIPVADFLALANGPEQQALSRLLEETDAGEIKRIECPDD